MENVTYDCGKLNLIPHTFIAPVVHCSFGDSGVTINFHVYKGNELFVFPANTVARVVGVRADGANWGPEEATISGSMVSFKLSQVMTGFQGSGMAEITFSEEEEDKVLRIGSANFAVMVEPATWFHGAAYADDVSTYMHILQYVEKSITSANAIISRADQILDDAVDAAKREVDTKLPPTVQDWLNKNVGKATGIADKSLTQSGAAADAKIVGDKINDLNAATRTLSGRTDYLSYKTNEMDNCCLDVNDEIRVLRNFVQNAKQLHPTVYLLDTDGNRLLTSDGRALLVSL